MNTSPLRLALTRLTNRELNRLKTELSMTDFTKSESLFHFSELSLSTAMGEKTNSKDIRKMFSEEKGIQRDLKRGGVFYFLSDLTERLEQFHFKYL